MEYILFVHNNADSHATKEMWDAFFDAAKKSGLFRGGSQIANSIQFGEKVVPDSTDRVAGFMRFESENIDAIKVLLNEHPVLLSGGTLELYEMQKT